MVLSHKQIEKLDKGYNFKTYMSNSVTKEKSARNKEIESKSNYCMS